MKKHKKKKRDKSTRDNSTDGKKSRKHRIKEQQVEAEKNSDDVINMSDVRKRQLLRDAVTDVTVI